MKFCLYHVISKAHVELSLARWQLSQWPHILTPLWFCPANWTKQCMRLPELTLQSALQGVSGALVLHVPRGRRHPGWPWMPHGDKRVSTSVDSWLATWSTTPLSIPYLPYYTFLIIKYRDFKTHLVTTSVTTTNASRHVKCTRKVQINWMSEKIFPLQVTSEIKMENQLKTSWKCLPKLSIF